MNFLVLPGKLLFDRKNNQIFGAGNSGNRILLVVGAKAIGVPINIHPILEMTSI